MKTEASPVITLTNDQPQNSLPIKAGELTNNAEVLEVAITKVTNPRMTPLSISVYLSDSEEEKSEPKRHLIGNFSLYPPDQPGKFLLSAAPALRAVSRSDASDKERDLRLVFEMKRIDESRPWTSVEVTIAEPTWRAAEK
ncbi:MAG TPA: hypothetical protein VMZ30_18800 [Pyrinomonadaceae bacterium]|nr:hypothetical protein [Pyrinomonadaceae bacterium]